MELQFTTLDVFTRTKYEGNPLAVIQVPPDTNLTQSQKQQIAKEFNLSESVFMHEPSSSASEVAIDIFTIHTELPFAGHPTIGSAVLAKSHLYPKVDALLTKAGKIELRSGNDGFMSAKIPHNVHLHSKTLGDVIPLGQHANYTGLSHFSSQIRELELSAPIMSCVKGMTFVLVPLPSLELLAECSSTTWLDFDKLPASVLDEGWSPSFIARYYYVENGAKLGTRKIRTRMLELGLEDPATGSAATALTCYLSGKESSSGQEKKFEITQGVEMGRKSVIHITTKVSGDGSGLDEVWLGGEAVVVMKGTISV